MLEKLFEYKICFNNHNRATGDSACNMRLFEATGMGCCLLTDHKSDLNTLFEPNVEGAYIRIFRGCGRKSKISFK